MKKITAILCAAMLAMCIGLVGCGGGGGGAAASSGSQYADGTYTGTGMGKGGEIAVTLTIADGVIIDVQIEGAEHETAGVGGKEGIEDGTFAEQILAAQSAEIDGVTGASLTSQGVQDATADALAQAEAAA